jgi:hypothetical protein
MKETHMVLVYDPTAEEAESQEALAIRLASLDGKVLGLLNNTKDRTDIIFDEVESLLPDYRERLLPPTETLAMFLAQALGSDRSCQFAVDTFVSRRVAFRKARSSRVTGRL